MSASDSCGDCRVFRSTCLTSPHFPSDKDPPSRADTAQARSPPRLKDLRKTSSPHQPPRAQVGPACCNGAPVATTPASPLSPSRDRLAAPLPPGKPFLCLLRLILSEVNRVNAALH